MGVSKDEFANLYDRNRQKLVGSAASPQELEENYRYYTTLVELSGGHGNLIFRLDDKNTLKWELAPQGKFIPTASRP